MQFNQFSQLDLHPDLLRGISALGFETPTPVQARAIPPALAGRDLLASASTGSGKTAAFLLPILHRLIDRPRGTTRALVVTPTRELAAQITAELTSLARFTPIRAATIYGGVGMAPQEKALRRGVDVIVATPGRLLDHLGRPYGNLDAVEFVVLDEADRMLDMGFLPDIKRILARVPTRRQTLLFSATIPREIADLTRRMQNDPVRVDLAPVSAPAAGITQTVYTVAQGDKTNLLVSLLDSGQVKDALVFTRTRRRADRLAKQLVKQGLGAERIHGGRSQSQRTKALAAFRSGRLRVLVATDVAARGIDVDALGHVINYDVPGAPDDYVHRVGRTARAEQTGDAFTFVSPDELSTLHDIERMLGGKITRGEKPATMGASRPSTNGHNGASNSNGAPRSSSRGKSSNGQRGQRGRQERAPKDQPKGEAKSRRRSVGSRRGTPRGRR
ncbi:MAG TPA: DEAD/DEAH box helicase [Gemmatimonadota bacterium]|nr:DEAD/DEAH box helicase [Gemmatimonadota bacterium]